MSPVLRIFGLIFRYYRRRIVLGYLAVIGSSLAGLAIPRVIGVGIDRVLDPQNVSRGTEALLGLAGILVLLGLTRGLFSWAQTFQAEGLSQNVAYKIRNDYYDRLQRLSFGFHDKQATGSLMSRATADVEAVRMFINVGAVRSLLIVVMIGGAGIAMVLTDVRLAAVTLAFIPLLAVRVVVASRRLRRVWLRAQELTADMVSTLQENLTGIRVVKAFAAEDHEIRKFRGRSRAVADQTYLAQSIWARNFAIMNFGFMLVISAVLWYGGNRVIDGRALIDGQTVYTNLTPGELASFFIYLNMLLMPVRMLGFTVNNFARASSSGQRLFEILDAQSPVHDVPGAKDMGVVEGRIRFEHVSFFYGEGNVDAGEGALRDIDIDVPAGSVVALVGRPGSGKTTFAHLIPRFYDVSEGAVLIDGHDVRDFTMSSLRRNVGVVQQDVFIHTASIRDNVAYGDVDADMERVIEVSRMAQLHDFIQELPDAYDTVVGERGVGLSGGQKQRLSIARTVLLDPPILILDDSTSSVDVHTERLIQQALDSVIATRTTFLISNRFQAIAKADEILVFQDGTIVQRGTHDELVSVAGEYAELYNSQMRPFEEARRAFFESQNGESQIGKSQAGAAEGQDRR
ncbi:MAG: ABC transporter ATP-binding protein [Dehalococcoidia bacterium]